MSNSSTLKELPTWRGKSKFRYSGCVTTGTEIHYGTNSKITVTKDDYSALLKTFAGQEVPIGTSRTPSSPNSVGAWLIAHVSPTALASYVGPILVDEKYAKRGRASDLIKFNS
jgi:hypothetical protein